MFEFFGQILKFVLWIFGVGRKKNDAERSEEKSHTLGELEVRNEDLEQSLKASQNAREIESRMQTEIAKSSQQSTRRAKPGKRIFPSMIYTIVLPSLIAFGILSCVPHHSPPFTTTMAVVCPQIPLPTRPTPPSLLIPEPNSNGMYCFSQQEMDSLVQGIDNLDTYARQLESLIKLYNKDRGKEEQNGKR